MKILIDREVIVKRLKYIVEDIRQNQFMANPEVRGLELSYKRQADKLDKLISDITGKIFNSEKYEEIN